MFRYWLIFCLLLIVSTACSTATSESTEPQSAESGEVADNEHADEHNEHDEHNNEHDEHEHDEDDDYREHGAHEHRAASLTIAWSGNELAIDLATPAFNVLGFEYAPTSEEDKALLEESVAALEAGDLLQLSSGADCTITSAEVHAEMSEEADTPEEDPEETHSDIDVAYTIQCQNPDDLDSLDASGLFDRFPNFAVLQVQWISDTQQSATELTADDPVVSLR